MNLLAHQAWLILRNDFRLLWRDLRSGRLRLLSSLPLLILFQVLLHAVTIMMFLGIRHSPNIVVETITWFFFAFLMLGTAMNNAVTVLFDRADFDLLLSAPISPRAILLARMVGMSAATAAAVAIFLLPILDGAVIGLSAQYAFGYLVWLLLAVAVTCVGVWFTLLLVRWLGPRRARTWAQVIAALLGATVYIGFQIHNALGPEIQGAMAAHTRRFFDSPAFTFVARAGHGEWLALAVLVALTAAIATITTRVLGRIFVTGIQEAGVTRARPRRAHRATPFSTHLGYATARKDLRLILRDPLLLSRVLPSVFYLVPALFPLYRMGQTGAAGLLAPFAVFAAAMLSSQLTSVAASGEEGWDLIRLSPASTVALRYAKIAAGAALPLLLVAVITVVIAFLGRPGLAAFSLLVAALSTVGSCWIEVAVIQPTPRKDLIQRSGRLSGRTTSPTRTIAAFLFIGIGTAAVALAGKGFWLLAVVGLAVVVLTCIGCFTLIPFEDIEFEATTTARDGRSAV